MKKHEAMHWRPGIVSHSDADAPSSWKYCCATWSGFGLGFGLGLGFGFGLGLGLAGSAAAPP